MRHFIVVATLLLVPVAASAQDAPYGSQSAPTPRLETGVDGYRVAAIAAGAVAGVVVANAVTGGIITPVLMAGSGMPVGAMAQPALAATTYTFMAVQAGVLGAGAVVGGYVGNWVYAQ